MDDALYVKLCLKLIEEKLRWKDHQTWTDQDYRKLCQIITDKSGIQLSTNTLKRLYGKVKYKELFHPQTATKNALAIFLDYSSWDDFIGKNQNLEINFEEKLKKRPFTHFKNKPVWFAGGVLLILLILFIWVMSKKKIETIEFETLHNQGNIPFTVSFKYDIASIGNDSVYVDFGYFHPALGYQKYTLDPHRNIINHCFQTPNLYEVKLIRKDKVLKSVPVLVKSNGWIGYVHPDTRVVSKTSSSETSNYSYWFGLDNMFRDTSNDGKLYASPAMIQALGFDNKRIYYTDFINIDTFNVDGDNFSYESRIRNVLKDGGISCFDSHIKLIFENGIDELRFMEKGCYRWSVLQFSETKKSGEFDDLSPLTLDLSDWRVIKIKTDQRNFSVLIDSRTVFSGNYQKPLGKLKGLVFYFKGSGMADYIKLFNNKGKLIYSDDFQKDCIHYK